MAMVGQGPRKRIDKDKLSQEKREKNTDNRSDSSLYSSYSLSMLHLLASPGHSIHYRRSWRKVMFKVWNDKTPDTFTNDFDLIW